MSNQSRHSRSINPDAAIGNALWGAESTVMVDRADLARRREELLGWMADDVETGPPSSAGGSKAEGGAAQGWATDLASLLSVAATALVSLLATEHWERTQAAASVLWRHTDPGRVNEVLVALKESRYELLEARHAGDEASEQDLVADWRRRLTRLVSAFPETVDELRRLLAEWDTAAGAPQPSTSVTRFTQSSRSVHMYQGSSETSRH